MAINDRWYFTKEQLAHTPSRKCGIDEAKEMGYRQQAAIIIKGIGQKLELSRFTINTAIVYMHRFYMIHSITRFTTDKLAAAALFLAAKVGEQPRKLEHIIKVTHMWLHRDQKSPDKKSQQYHEQVEDLILNEKILLQTLGFDVVIAHPHSDILLWRDSVRGSQDLARTSYDMASDSLRLTTMCLQYKPSIVACICIHIASKRSNLEIPKSHDGKPWFWHVDKSMSHELLEQLTAEFLPIFNKGRSRLKNGLDHSQTSDDGSTLQTQRNPASQPKDESKKPSTSLTQQPQDYLEYCQRKARERLEHEKMSGISGSGSTSGSSDHRHHSNHPKQVSSSSTDPPCKTLSNKHPLPNQKQSLHHNHHRPDPKLQQHITICSQSQTAKHIEGTSLKTYPMQYDKRAPSSTKVVDIVQKRTEEVRKLIEKPLLVSTPRVEFQNKEFISSMIKQSHNPLKYSMEEIKNGCSSTSLEVENKIDESKLGQKPRAENAIPAFQPVPIKRQSIFSPEKKIPTSSLTGPHFRQKSQPMSLLNSQLLPQSPKQLGTMKTKKNIDVSVKKIDGCVQNLGQPISLDRDSTNIRLNSVINNVKLPDINRLRDVAIKDTSNLLRNRLDSMNRKPETMFDMSVLEKLKETPLNEYLTPMKTTQSINALLQEPLVPSSSLLLINDDSLTKKSKTCNLSQTLSNQRSYSSINDKNAIHINSTISESFQITKPPQILPEQLMEEDSSTCIDLIVPSKHVVSNNDGVIKNNYNPVGTSGLDTIKHKSPEHHHHHHHHKSERKKKKDKHKHKDKSKDRHKHKDKSKEKHKHQEEKHRNNSALSIKMAIPKDRLNLESSTWLDQKAPHADNYKIKLTKENLSSAQQIQAPIKIKIRTNVGGAIGNEGVVLQSRKRERERAVIDQVPPIKKPLICSDKK